jgi:hypothetical protein
VAIALAMKVVPERGAATMKKMRSASAVARALVPSRCRPGGGCGHEARIARGFFNETRITRDGWHTVLRAYRRDSRQHFKSPALRSSRMRRSDMRTLRGSFT